MITQKLIRHIFDYRDGNLYWNVPRSGVKFGSLAGSLREDGYRDIRVDGRAYRAHRLIFLYHHGYLPKMLDHIDRDTSNNDINNLRETTQSQNGMNRKKSKSYNGKPTSSIYKGVYWSKRAGKWQVAIQINWITRYIGCFVSEADAARAYNIEAIKLQGEFANLNDVEDIK